MTMPRFVFIVASWIAVAATEALAALPPPATAVSPADKPTRSAQDGRSDEARYAERERDTQGLTKFRGGEGVRIYIGGGAVAVALVVVIVLLIL